MKTNRDESGEVSAIRRAIKIVEAFDEPYRSLSFPVVLERLLDERHESGQAAERPSSRKMASSRESPQSAGPPVVSFVELYRTFAPKNNYERVILALYHLHKYGAVEPATVSQVEAKLWEARVRFGGLPQYLSDLCAPKKSMVTAVPISGAKNAYHLLKGGYDLVESRLSNQS